MLLYLVDEMGTHIRRKKFDIRGGGNRRSQGGSGFALLYSECFAHAFSRAERRPVIASCCTLGQPQLTCSFIICKG